MSLSICISRINYVINHQCHLSSTSMSPINYIINHLCHQPSCGMPQVNYIINHLYHHHQLYHVPTIYITHQLCHQPFMSPITMSYIIYITNHLYHQQYIWHHPFMTSTICDIKDVQHQQYLSLTIYITNQLTIFVTNHLYHISTITSIFRWPISYVISPLCDQPSACMSTTTYFGKNQSILPTIYGINQLCCKPSVSPFIYATNNLFHQPSISPTKSIKTIYNQSMN